MREHRDGRGAQRRAGAMAGLVLAALLITTRARAGEPAPFAARAGLDLATAAAHAWAPDAELIYLENDEPLAADGTAPRWGYLFYSPTVDRARAYSVRDGRIVTAEFLDMKFEAPPLADGWIDSGPAEVAGAETAAREMRKSPGASLATMLLMRGALDESTPDQTSWLLVYRAPGAPSLFVVVNAADGKVRRTWRG